jgi:hypothetical protein
VRRREEGFAAVEWTIGVGLIVLPIAILVASLPPWFERAAMARVMAQEAARAMVRADSWDEGAEAAEELARQISANHGIEPDEWCGLDAGCMWIGFGGTTPGMIERGTEIEVFVNVPMPGITVPFVGSVGEVGWTTSHVERVDDFRSIP